MLIDIVYIAAAGIGLPDFHQGIGNRTLVFIQHMPMHDDTLAQRLSRALPADTTTLLHRDGSAPPGPRPVRATAAEALAVIAELSGKERYSVEGLLPAEEVRRRRAWQRVCRVAALLFWRRLLAVSVRV